MKHEPLPSWARKEQCPRVTTQIIQNEAEALKDQIRTFLSHIVPGSSSCWSLKCTAPGSHGEQCAMIARHVYVPNVFMGHIRPPISVWLSLGQESLHDLVAFSLGRQRKFPTSHLKSGVRPRCNWCFKLGAYKYK